MISFFVAGQLTEESGAETVYVVKISLTVSVVILCANNGIPADG